MAGFLLRLRGAAVASGLAPVFTVAPVMSMSGSHLDVGETVTCSTGTIVGADIIEYQWEVGGVPLHASLGVLAWDTTFAIPKGLQWEVPRCKVTATNAHGSTVAYSNDLGRVTVDFSTKTLAGHGQKPLGLGPVTITGGMNAADFTMLSGAIAPSGVKNTAKTWAASRYALTLSDGTTIKLRIVNDGFTIAATAADTRTNNELEKVLILTGATAPKLGDNIWVRDGYWNPLNSNWFIDIAPGGYGAGTGTHVEIRSERVDLTLDSDLAPNRKHGAKFGPILTFHDGEIDAKVRFLETWHTVTLSPVPVGTHLHAHTGSTQGWGINFKGCRGDVDPSAVDPGEANGFKLNAGATVEDCTLTNMYHAIIASGSKTRGDFVSQRNVFRGVRSDCHQVNGSNIYVQDNMAYDANTGPGDHPDFCQHLGAADGDTEINIVVERNLVFRNKGSLNAADFQCVFLTGSAGAGRITPTVRNNITYVTSAQGAWVAKGLDPTVEFNTCLTDYDANTSSILEQAITASTEFPGENGTWNRNLSMGFNVSSQGGTVTATLNQVLGANKAAVTAALPGLLNVAGGTTPCNRRTRLINATPPLLAAPAGVLQTDGTVTGALFPSANENEPGAWNDGSVYDPGNPTWVAAHPPAA